MTTKPLDKYRAYLAIDKLDLDRCLQEQPEIYNKVATHYANAIAYRDEAKLVLEETTAELDQSIRAKVDEDEKLTEKMVEQRLRQLPKIQELARDYLDAKLEAEQWGALKESFQQRSFALRELVALRLGELRDLALEAGAGQERSALADGITTAASSMRRNRSKR